MRAAVNTLLVTLANPTRRAIFERLCRSGEQTVRVLTARSGVSQPAVSKHLDLLKRSGLVRRRRLGRETYYSARPEGLIPIVDWTDVHSASWRQRAKQQENLQVRADQ